MTTCRRCPQLLRSDNKSGYCTAHNHIGYYVRVLGLRRRKQTRFCLVCDEPVHGSNKTRVHLYHRKRARVAKRSCPVCQVELRSDNTVGYCRAHRKQAPERKLRERG